MIINYALFWLNKHENKEYLDSECFINVKIYAYWVKTKIKKPNKNSTKLWHFLD